jgi:hypothetical protein
MSQLGAEIEQSVQNLEQEMKVSENQLNYLEVGRLGFPAIHTMHLAVYTYNLLPELSSMHENICMTGGVGFQ